MRFIDSEKLKPVFYVKKTVLCLVLCKTPCNMQQTVCNSLICSIVGYNVQCAVHLVKLTRKMCILHTFMLSLK